MSSEAVFLSYASRDEREARRVLEYLRAAGVSVWIDREIAATEIYTRRITEAIEHCRVLLYVHSVHAVRSKHVRNEVIAAFEKGRRILPLWLDDSPANPDLEHCLVGLQGIDAASGLSKRALEGLQRQIVGLLSGGSAAQQEMPDAAAPTASAGRRTWPTAGAALLVAAAAAAFFLDAAADKESGIQAGGPATSSSSAPSVEPSALDLTDLATEPSDPREVQPRESELLGFRARIEALSTELLRSGGHAKLSADLALIAKRLDEFQQDPSGAVETEGFPALAGWVDSVEGHIAELIDLRTRVDDAEAEIARASEGPRATWAPASLSAGKAASQEARSRLREADFIGAAEAVERLQSAVRQWEERVSPIVSWDAQGLLLRCAVRSDVVGGSIPRAKNLSRRRCETWLRLLLEERDLELEPVEFRQVVDSAEYDREGFEVTETSWTFRWRFRV